MDPVKVAYLTFLGPLLGSLSRPAGGWLADRFGGARTTFWNFAVMALAAAVVLVASGQRSLGLFFAGFIALFALSGIGNGSTYKMIPAIFRAQGTAAASRPAPTRRPPSTTPAALQRGHRHRRGGRRGRRRAGQCRIPAVVPRLRAPATPHTSPSSRSTLICVAATWLVYLRPVAHGAWPASEPGHQPGVWAGSTASCRRGYRLARVRRRAGNRASPRSG